MAIKHQLNEEFLQSFSETEAALMILSFRKSSSFEKGLAIYIEYINENNTRVEFIFGPPDWDVEMIIYTSKQKLAFKDLLEIPTIAKWISDNRYNQENGRNMKNELLWLVELLRFSLPMIE